MEKDDIVQIIDEKHHWYSCLIIVSEVKPWGIQGYMTIPRDNKGNVGDAYIRLKFDQIEKVGKASTISA